MMCLSYKASPLVVQVKESGDRHPKVREGVMIGAGAKILGNIEVGKNTPKSAPIVVLQPVPEYATAAGVPARIVRQRQSGKTCL